MRDTGANPKNRQQNWTMQGGSEKARDKRIGI